MSQRRQGEFPQYAAAIRLDRYMHVDLSCCHHDFLIRETFQGNLVQYTQAAGFLPQVAS